jgi:plasmid maintenance system antidote protein VapI
MSDGAILKAHLEKQGINKTKFAASLGMSKQNLYQLFESKVFKPDTVTLLEKKFRVRWEKLVKEGVNIDLQEQSIEVKREKKNGSIENQDRLIEAIITITRNNEKLVDTNDKIADTNKVLANKLVSMNPGITAGADLKTLEETVTMVLGLREYIIDLGSELKKVPPREISQALHSKVKSEKEKIGKTGIQSGLGK